MLKNYLDRLCLSDFSLTNCRDRNRDTLGSEIWFEPSPFETQSNGCLEQTGPHESVNPRSLGKCIPVEQCPPPPPPIPHPVLQQFWTRINCSCATCAGQDFRNSGTNLFHLEISFSFYCCRAESKPDPISKRRSLLLYCQNFLFLKCTHLKDLKW